MEGLGNPGSEHANTEEDEKSGAEADGGDDADTEGLAALQMTAGKTNDDICSLSDLTSVAAAREAKTLSGHLSSGLLAPAA